MLKNLGLLLILSIFVFGCNFTSGTKTEEGTTEKTEGTTTEKKEESAKVEVGDTVVAKWSSGSFYEGKVESLDGNKAKVKWNDGSNPSDVDMSDVYSIPESGAKPDVKQGDMVLAKVQSNSYWSGAEVTEVKGDVYVVKAVGSSSTTNLDGNKIIKVTPATAATFKDKVDSNDFLKKAQAKSPKAPNGYKPKKGDKVVALWATNSWWSGKVNNISGDKVSVAWDDGSKPSDIDMDKVMPAPNASNTKMPEAESHVLAKPQSGSRWQYGQVTEVKSDSIVIKNSRGENRTLKMGEFIPLS